MPGADGLNGCTCQSVLVAKACRIAYQEGFALPGQRIIISAGVPLGTPGATNLLRIAFVGDETEDF